MHPEGLDDDELEQIRCVSIVLFLSLVLTPCSRYEDFTTIGYMFHR